MMISEPLSQYEEILKDAIRTSMKESGAKLAKTFQTLLIEVLTPDRVLLSRQQAVYGTYGLSDKTQETVGLCVQRIVRLTECCQGLHERQWHGQFHGKS